MALAHNFTFSQASLQDYVDCPRRFQLRYVLDVRWPAVHDGPIVEWEQKARQGAVFHRLVHQHTAGIPAEVLGNVAGGGEVGSWWQAYLDAPPRDLPVTERHSEVRLSMRLGDHRLIARYDLLAIEPGNRAVIVDWKTGQKRPTRAWLEKRLQTQVYRHVLVRAGAHWNDGRPFSPEQVELVYWFANYAVQVERFPYDDAQHELVERQLTATIAEIVQLDRAQWPLTTDLRRCKYCPYRTLCDREVAEGVTEDEPENEADPFDLVLEQIAEIEF